MLYLYPKNTVDFTNNGDPIRYSFDEHVVRDDGFYLTFNLLLDKEKDYKKIKKEMIISANTPDGINQFRIYDIKNKSTSVEVTAVQLMYDFDNKEVNPFSLNNATGSQVISRFKSSFKSTLGQFTMDSSVTETHDFATNDEDDDTPSHNALEILNRITDRWDSELMLNGFDIRMIKRLGAKTDALLYEKKNISEFEDASSVSGMITRIHATSKFTPEGKEDEVTLSVTVDSPLINEYAQIYEKSYVNNDCRTEAELIAWTKLKYSTENVDKPSRSITVSTNIIDGTEINYGDDLVLKYLVHDVDEIIRCVGYDYDPIKNTYYSVTLGDWKDSFATTLTGGLVDTTNRQINQIKNNITYVLMSANGKNRNAYGPEPVPNPINGDNWYYYEFDRPNDIELRIFQDGFWVAIDFATKKEVESVIEQADLDRAKTEQDINQALIDAKNYTELKAQMFDNQLLLVNQNVLTAANSANAAVLKADKAIEDIGFAQVDATNALNGIISIQTAINGLQVTVAEKADKSQITQLAGQIQTKVESATYSTKMTQLDNVINNQLVYKGNVVAQFNMDNGTTLIQNGKLILDANTYIMGTTFANDVKAKSIEAVYADIPTIRNKVLITDAVTTDMIKADAGLFDKVFINDAVVNKLTAKSSFFTAVKSIEITADKLNGGTANFANFNTVNFNASNVVSGTFNGLTFTNPYSVNGLTGTTVLKGDLTSSYTKNNGQYGTMAFSRDRIFSNLYGSNGSLITGYNLSSEALNFNSSFGAATYNFDNVRVARNDGATSEIIFAYTGYGMQIHSDYGIKLGRHYFGKKETLIEVGTGNSPDVRFGADVSLLTHDLYNVGKIRFNAESYITAPSADGLDLRARSFTKFTLSGWDAMYLTRDGSTGINNMDIYGNLNMQGKIDMKTNSITNSGRIYFNDQSYVDAPSIDSSRLNARTYTAFTLSGWDVMYLVRDQNTGNNRMDMYGNINMNSFQLLNNSDRRLKQNIQATNVVALDAYRNLNVVDYEWRDPKKPQGRHLGVIAQETSFWSEYDASTDIWNVSSSKQIMYNSLGIKELTSIVDSHTQRLQQLNQKVVSINSVLIATNSIANNAMNKAIQVDSEVQQMKNKILELEKEIKTLKGAA